MKSERDITQILAFLRQLATHNERPWFQAHKAEYDALRAPWERDMQRLIDLVGQFDDNVGTLPLKQCVYRIYRDVRFSRDKSPYKTYFSGVIGRGGRHTVRSSYYVHFQPDYLMLGGGIWWPERDVLARLRALIDAEYNEFRDIISHPDITSKYHWESNSLKAMPKGYSADNPAAEFLKMKEYLLIMRPDDDYFRCDDWVERVARDLRPLQPLHRFLNYVFD